MNGESSSEGASRSPALTDGRVRLNIGGKIFDTSRFTLKRIPHTVLSTMVESRWTSEGASLPAEIFIDRDPAHFDKILNFLRDGQSFVIPKDEIVVEEMRREAQFYQIGDLVEILTAALTPLAVGDTVGWRPDAIALYWRSFVRYSVDDSLTLPFIYERLIYVSPLRNNHTLARCIGCEEVQDPKGSYIFEINYSDWEPMRHHMQTMSAEVTQIMPPSCCNVVWDNGQTIHLPMSAIRKTFPLVAD